MNEVTVVARNVSYQVKGAKEVRLLDNVNLCVQPNHMLVIMGPSGSGKTTLLNALSGRIRRGSHHVLSGDIFYIDQTQRKMGDIRRFSSYVTQHDRLMEFLTVEETISFAANLKLRHKSRSERQRKVENVLEELALDTIRTVQVGGQGGKGISGGQKKRVAIAIELLDEPSLLFLDEPTSGLDSSLAYDTLCTLSSLAHSGRTVICTIHQPRSQTFALFDQLMLLHGGKVVYLGDSCQATTYFDALGFSCPSQFNPADFLLDILSAQRKEENKSEEMKEGDPSFIYRLAHSISEYILAAPVAGGLDLGADPLPHPSFIISSPAQSRRTSWVVPSKPRRCAVPPERIAQLADDFAESSLALDLQANIDAALLMKSEAPPNSGSKKISGMKTNCSSMAIQDWFSTYSTLTRRFLLNDFRNPIETVARIALNVAYGLIIGGIFFQLPRGGRTVEQSTVRAQAIVGTLYFQVTQLTFSQLDNLLTLPKDRKFFNRETANGLYTPSSYFFAQTTAKFPFLQIPSFLYLSICYFMMGFSMTAWQFFQQQLIGVLCVFASIGYCLMIGAAFCSVEIVYLSAPFGLTVIMLLAGYFVYDEEIPWWIGWAKYVAFMRYAYFAFVQTEFPLGQISGVVSSESLWEQLEIPQTPSVWGNVGILFALGVGTRCIAFLFLTFFNREYGVDT